MYRHIKKQTKRERAYIEHQRLNRPEQLRRGRFWAPIAVQVVNLAMAMHKRIKESKFKNASQFIQP